MNDITEFQGTVSELGDEGCRPYEYDSELKAVSLSDSEIWLVWNEEGQEHECLLKPTMISDNECWVGQLVCSNIDNEGELLAVRYDLAGGGALLIAEWKFDGDSGKYAIEINKR